MNDPDGPLRGSCLCGGVTYEVTRPVRDVFECHCHRCRKHTGNVMAATAAPGRAITFHADATLRWYEPDDDPNVQYGFCAHCGSSLFWRAGTPAPDASVSICAGPLDEPTGLRTGEIWFACDAGDHVTLTPGIPRR